MKKILSILTVSLMLLTACKSSKNTSSSSDKAEKSTANVETWIIADQKAACAEGSTELCYQVKKVGESDYTPMNITIEGFSYEEGNKYQVVVNVVNGKYSLKEVLYKIPSK